MTPTILRGVTAGVLLAATAGCGLLDVTDPTAIEEKDVNTATGADLLRRDAVGRLYLAISQGALVSGILTDELFDLVDFTLDQRTDDARRSAATSYTQWQEVRRAATLAFPQLLSHGAPATRRPYVGQMFAVRGFATLGLAEGFCPGFPLHEIVDFEPIYGAPLTTEQVFEHALADFDSALTNAADSARILNLARVGRGRALLGLGRFAEAAAAVDGVPTEFEWRAEYSSTVPGQTNNVALQTTANFVSVANRQGGNGVDFVQAEDPRLVVQRNRTQFGIDYYSAVKYADRGAPIDIASGIEARLIQAEAAMRADDPSWLVSLNDLRDTQVDAVMGPLVDPGYEQERVDLLFRERAFWLFGTGHRLGDLRRLMTYYGRPSDTLFPVGEFFQGESPERPRGNFGPLTSLPFPAELEAPYSPAVTGCTGL